MENHETVIIGCGISALVLAARLVELGKTDIGIYSLAHGGTPYIAAINFVLEGNPSGDSPEIYAEDMLAAGYRIADKKFVGELCAASSEGWELLKRWGVDFSLMEDGSPRLRRTSGSSKARSLCSTEGLIGLEILSKLEGGLAKHGIIPKLGCECVGLLKEEGRVCGATFRKGGRLFSVGASAVVAAWGGVGGLLGPSTYPGDVDGKMFAEAFEAGAKLIDMEFLEFEPMILLSPPAAKGEPCPTAMLGEGALLLNSDMERFVLKFRVEGEAGAPKTLLNKAIWSELSEGRGTPNGGVWADLRMISEDVLKAYPWFYGRLMDAGKNPKEELIEVAPVAHSFAGGIAVDEDYASTVKGLYAVGEAAGGLHGACRIGGNAASQATLSALLCAQALAKLSPEKPPEEKEPAEARDAKLACQYSKELDILSEHALGAFRSKEPLEKAEKRLLKLFAEKALEGDAPTKRRALVILIMLEAALAREESRGVHLRTDFPKARAEFEQEIKIVRGEDGNPRAQM